MFVDEPARQTPVLREVDVVVLGGGPAGVAAAAASARAGARTVLVERYGFLGGMGTAAMVTNFCGLHANVHGEIQIVVKGVAEEILSRLERLGGLGTPHSVLGRTVAQCYDNAIYRCVLDDILDGSGVHLDFHALAVGIEMHDGCVSSLLIETKSGRRAIRGSVFIDCSGDADLATWAGCPYEKGNDDGFLAYPTLMFRMGHVDTQRARTEGKPNIRKLMAEAEATGEWAFPRRAAYINPQPHDGEWRANVTQISRAGRPIDGTNHDDFAFAELEGRRQIARFFSFLKAKVPGFESSYLLDIAPQVGIRETRRIVGDYQVTRDDVLACKDFDDAIGVNGWPVEKHLLGEVEWTFLEGRGYHQIPFRCLLPTGVENLLVAGRCLSATQDAQASLRVSGACFAMGQAAGTAAALAIRAGLRPRQVPYDALRKQLVADGVFLGA
jgi:hypothetical protein